MIPHFQEMGMKAAALSVVLLFSVLAAAQETHKFWDAQNTVSFAVTAGIRAVDIVESCRTIGQGAREAWLPVKSCGGVAAWIAGGQVTQTGFQFWMHKAGHHRLERLVPWVAVAPNMAAIGFTITHQGKSAPTSNVDQFGCIRSYSPETGWLTDCSHAHP
jgi:hypothetical protein